MKKNNILIAVFALLAAASAAGAEDIKVDFDGKKGATVGFSELLESGSTCRDNNADSAMPKPERVQVAENTPRREVKINVIMKAGTSVKKETVVCEARKGGPAVNGCKKQSDFMRLTYEDIAAMSLRKYFPVEKPEFASLLNQTKHSYTNQSGPQTFQCDDTCGKYDWSVTLSPFPPYLEEATWTCVEMTHECECVAGCY